MGITFQKMSLVKALYFLSIFAGLVSLMLGKEGIQCHLKANRCNIFNPKFVLNSTCRVRAFNRSTQLMSYSTFFRPGIKLYEYKINITSYRKFGTAYRPSLIKLREDWCAAMNGSASHYFRIMSPSLKKYGNVVKPCPISGHMYVKDMIVDTSNFPPFAPIGEYRMDYHYYTIINNTEEFVRLLQDFWEVTPLGALEF